jgi:hypothetical protein
MKVEIPHLQGRWENAAVADCPLREVRMKAMLLKEQATWETMGTSGSQEGRWESGAVVDSPRMPSRIKSPDQSRWGNGAASDSIRHTVIRTARSLKARPSRRI